MTCNGTELDSIRIDPRSESRVEKPHPVYVPRDETFEEIKQNTFSAGRLKALLHNLIPSIAAALSSSDVPFTCFTDIDKLYSDGFLLKDEEQNEGFKFPFAGTFVNQILSVQERLFKYDIPAVIKSEFHEISSQCCYLQELQLWFLVHGKQMN